MKVTRHIPADVERVVRAVESMVRADMETALIGASGDAEGFPGQSFAGCTYTKQLAGRTGKPETTTVRIERLDASGYEVSFHSRFGDNKIVYTFEPCESDGVDVTYEESFKSGTRSIGLSHSFFAALTSRGNRKRAEAQLEAFERYVLKQG